MNARLAILLTLSLTTTGLCAVVETDPNYAAPNPEFIPGSDPKEWVVFASGAGSTFKAYSNPGSIRPTHVAEGGMGRGNGDRMFRTGAQVLEFTLRSPIAQKLSKAQKDFLAEGYGIWVNPGESERPNKYPVWFYAVSQEDAKTMVLAFLDSLTRDAREYADEFKRRRDNAKEQLQRDEAALPEKQKSLENVSAQYAKVKSESYPLLSDDEVKQTAREIVLQMDKEARIVEVDLAGVRGKLKVIDKYIANNYRIAEGAQDPVRLTTWKTEQMIELSGLEARQQAIAAIRAVPLKLDALSRQRRDLEKTVEDLTTAVERDKQTFEQHSTALEHPGPGSTLFLPKMYDHVVLIDPIRPPTRPNSIPAQ
jgi:hypothetical protein